MSWGKFPMKRFLRLVIAARMIAPLFAGPFPPAAGVSGSDAISASDSRFTLWATAATVDRGPTEIDFPGSALASYGTETDAIGPADANPNSPYPVVSLGDGGTATLEFSQPFGDVPGPDLAVFENGFSASFLELAHVEVSSDGVNFFRFPSTSLTPASANLGEGGAVDPTNVHNLAGKYLAGFGTPFDLAELRHRSPLLDIQRITHVRVIDAVGTNDPAFASRDATGGFVIDPYPTAFFSGGFDLDAVGAFSPTTTTFAAWKISQNIAISDPTADSNHDGVPNLIEYLTGTGRVTPSHSGVTRTLQFSRLAYRAEGNLRLEGSADLKTWTPLAQSVQGVAMTATAPGVSVAETGNAALQITVTLPANAVWKFFRLAAQP